VRTCVSVIATHVHTHAPARSASTATTVLPPNRSASESAASACARDCSLRLSDTRSTTPTHLHECTASLCNVCERNKIAHDDSMCAAVCHKTDTRASAHACLRAQRLTVEFIAHECVGEQPLGELEMRAVSESSARTHVSIERSAIRIFSPERGQQRRDGAQHRCQSRLCVVNNTARTGTHNAPV
jgi:hypothetical protein